MEAAGAIIRGITRQVGNEIDEFVTEALRNNLLGLPLDLPAINMARGRDTGVPSLNEARAEFYAMTGDSQLKPYASWADLASNLKHAESLVNFIAAYGTHASITGATTTADKRAAAYALVYGEGGMDGIATGDEPTVAVPTDRLDFLTARSRPTACAFLNGRGGDHRPRRRRPVDRRPRREADAVRRPARLDLQLRLRDADGEAAGRRPLLLPRAHRRA